MSLSTKKIVLWRWDKPSEIFEPTESTFYRDIMFKTHNKCVRAGLNPLDWMRMMKGRGIVLHKIVLTRQQAERCVVAEGCFIPTHEELSEFIKKKHIMQPVGILRYYQDENYEKSFVPLLKYSDEYNLPEVLIPFSVKAEAICYAKVHVIVWKLKAWFLRKIKIGCGLVQQAAKTV